MRRRAAIVPPFTVTWWPAGHRATGAQPGDALLVHGYHSLASAAIRAGAWLSRTNHDYRWPNHACLVLAGGEDATVVQEVGSGAIVSPLSTFDDALYALVHIDTATQVQRDASVAFARWSIGERYSWASVVADGVDDLTGLELGVSSWGRMVCSSATTRALERQGLIPDRDPSAAQPADLARWFDLSMAALALALSTDAPSVLA